MCREINRVGARVCVYVPFCTVTLNAQSGGYVNGQITGMARVRMGSQARGSWMNTSLTISPQKCRWHCEIRLIYERYQHLDERRFLRAVIIFDFKHTPYCITFYKYLFLLLILLCNKTGKYLKKGNKIVILLRIFFFTIQNWLLLLSQMDKLLDLFEMQWCDLFVHWLALTSYNEIISNEDFSRHGWYFAERGWNISTRKGARTFVLKRNQDGRSEWSHQWRVAGNAKGTLSRGTSGGDQCNF